MRERERARAREREREREREDGTECGREIGRERERVYVQFIRNYWITREWERCWPCGRTGTATLLRVVLCRV